MLNWISNSYAIEAQVLGNSSLFEQIKEKIHNQKTCGIEYNPSKTAAIVGGTCGAADYINLKTKQTYAIARQYRGFYIKWLDDRVATLEAGCGTGCLVAYIFVAPATVVSCSNHDYRINFLDPHQPPDYSHNRPLLVDPKKGIYVCYDGEDNIQIFLLPRQATIRPPKEFFSEKAEIRNGKLIVTYKNGHGKIKWVSYVLANEN